MTGVRKLRRSRTDVHDRAGVEHSLQGWECAISLDAFEDFRSP